jgi:hypothetical protein
MSVLKDKIDYLKNGFINGKPTKENQDSLLFLNEIIEEISSDNDNYNEFKNDISLIYSKCIEELKVAPLETKTILLNNIFKNIGIDSSLKEEVKTKTPIFKEFISEKQKEEIVEEIDLLFNYSFDENYKRIEIDTLLAVSKEALNKEENSNLLSNYINSDKFNKLEVSKIMAATIALNSFTKEGMYNLTENQNVLLENLVIEINNICDKNEDFKKNLDEEVEKYKKFMFFNSLNVESQLHEMKNEILDSSNGVISNHPIEESLKETLENNKKRNKDIELDVETRDWERMYREYLHNLTSPESSIKVMSSSDKFKQKFASHGFAPATASLFGDSIVMADKYGDPQKTLWNISPLTGTMRLSRDVDYSNPALKEQTFAIAALNARRNNWSTVYLNHPGPDQEAKAFLESSIAAMVEIGHYNFEEISVPRKYQHILDHIKNTYATIENGVNNKEDKTVEINLSEEKEIITPDNKVENKSDLPKPTPNTEMVEVKEDIEASSNKTDISEFDSDNAIFDNEENPPAYLLEGDSDYTNVNLGDQDLGNEDYEVPELGDLKLDDSSKELLENKDMKDNFEDNPPSKNTPKPRQKLF